MRFRFSAVLIALTLLMANVTWISPVARVSAAPALKTISASGTITGGGKIAIKITLTEAAPTGGTIVKLKASRPSIIPVPATATVPKGKTEITLPPVTTKASRTTAPVTLTATLGSVSKTRDVMVKAPIVSGVNGIKSINGGSINEVTYRLNAKAGAGGMPIELRVSRPSLVTVLTANPKVLEGETTVVIRYQVGSPRGSTTFTIEALATDNGIDNLPPDSRPKSVSHAVTIQATNATATATATKTSTATSTATTEAPTSTSTATNTIAAPTSTSTATATSTSQTPTLTATATSTTITAELSEGCTWFNDNQFDVTNSGFHAAMADMNAGEILIITNAQSLPFEVEVQAPSGTENFANQLTFVYTAGNTGYHTVIWSFGIGNMTQATWAVSCGFDGATPVTATATSAASTATATPPAELSEGCQWLNLEMYDDTTPGYMAAQLPMFAGEVVSLFASGVSFGLDVAGAQTLSLTGLTSYAWTAPQSGMYDLQWVTSNFGNADWTVECGSEASNPPTATATTESPTSTATPAQASAGCVALNDAWYDQTTWSMSDWPSLAVGDIVTIRAAGSAYPVWVKFTGPVNFDQQGATGYSYTVTVAGQYLLEYSTVGQENTPWDVSCGLTAPATATPAPPTSTATSAPTVTNTAVPPTPTNTVAAPPPLSLGCMILADTLGAEPFYLGQTFSNVFTAGEVITINAYGAQFSFSATSPTGVVTSVSQTAYTFNINESGSWVFSWNASPAQWWAGTCGRP